MSNATIEINRYTDEQPNGITPELSSVEHAKVAAFVARNEIRNVSIHVLAEDYAKHAGAFPMSGDHIAYRAPEDPESYIE